MLIEIKVPDVGNVAEINVVEVLIKAGDTVALEQTVATLETDKASMDLPSSASGIIQQVHIKAGDKVAEGSLIATVLSEQTGVTESVPTQTAPAQLAESPIEQPVEQPIVQAKPEAVVQPTDVGSPSSVGAKACIAHASPSVRVFARELGVDLSVIKTGSGRKGRILKDDVKQYVKKVITEGNLAVTGTIPPIPAVDFSLYGDCESVALSKIKKLTGQNLSRVWLNLPMVTFHDEVDITELEAFRVALNSERSKDEVKITVLLFIIKALLACLQKYPNFNASLSVDGEQLILKKYFNIGIAVDTPNGLVVPVLKNVDGKSISKLAEELAEKSDKARKGKLMPADMQGGCFTISSLGGIGGTAFTPIVNAPEVAILGVTRAKTQPVWNGSEFIPRLMLPLDITYDHRVIDGAEGARFMAALKHFLGDIRRLLI